MQLLTLIPYYDHIGGMFEWNKRTGEMNKILWDWNGE